MTRTTKDLSASPLDREAGTDVDNGRRLGAVERRAHTHGAGALSGFRNALINGCMRVWQRGGGAFTAAGKNADMWALALSGSTVSLTRQASTPGDIASLAPTPLAEPQYFMRAAVTSVAGAGNFVMLYNHMEDVRTLAGQTVTVSFWAKANATKKIAADITQYFGTGGSPSTSVSTPSQQVPQTIDTTWQRVTLTFAVPSLTGKTIGSNNDGALTLAIWLDAGSTYNARTNTLGQQSGTFDIWGVQVEAGAVASPFEYRPQQTELALCQRYFQRRVLPMARGAFGNTNAVSRAAFALVVPMRVAPTVTAVGTFNWYDGSNGQVSALSSITWYVTQYEVEFDCLLASSVHVIGRPALLYQGGTGYFDCSAEI